MTMCYEFQKWSILTMAAVAITLTIGLIEIVYGSAIEDPLTPTLQEKLLQQAREWNIEKVINETLDTAERFAK